MQNYIGLYYPYIHFRRDSWLKLAALYWDKMARIVPDLHSPRDSEIVRVLQSEIDFVENIRPNIELEKVSNLFLELINVDEDASLSQVIWRPDSYIKRNCKVLDRYKVSTNQSGLTEIYCGKVAYALREALIETCLAVRRSNDGEFLLMHPKLASVYMTALAKEMAHNHQFFPVAEADHEHIAIIGNSVQQLAELLLTDEQDDEPTRRPTHSNLGMEMAYIAIESIIPMNIESVPITKIVEVRQKFGDELRVFQSEFHKIVTEQKWLENINDPEALKMHLEELCDKGINSKLRDLKKDLKTWGIETTSSAVGVLVALPIAATSGIIGGVTTNPLLFGLGAVAYAPVPFLLKARTAREQLLAASPASYLLHLEEEITPTTLIDRMSKKVRQITYGF